MLKDYFAAADRVTAFARRVRESVEEADFTSRDDIVPGATVSGDLLRLPPHVLRGFGRERRAVFDLFARIAGTGLYLSEETRGRLSSLAAIIDDEFREDPDAADSFLTLLRAERATDSLRALHSIGVLGAYLPPFGAVRGLVPYDVFHTYPADEHTLLALEFFDRLRSGMGPEALVQEARAVAAPELLRLAILLHDTGKVGGPGHQDRAARMTPVVCLRLGLAERDTQYVVRLVREHEALSHAAHTRDVEDPAVSRHLADKMGDPESLRALFVLTYCDMRAVGPGVWTMWRAGLIEHLYGRAASYMVRGSLDESRRERFEEIAQTVAGLAPPEVVTPYLATMRAHHPSWLTPKLAERHLRTLDQYAVTEKPLVGVYWDDDETGTGEAVACAPDVPGFLAKAAGLFASERLNILGAQAFGTDDGLALDTIQFLPRDPHFERSGLDRKLTEKLRRLLAGALDAEKLLEEGERRAVGTRVSPHIATEIRIDNHASGRHTVVEIWTADRTGLLYRIAKSLFDFGLSIALAKINTISGRAIDAFYVVDSEGQKVTGKAASELRAALRAALER
ncbi:MAG: HD domain-containing protein [Deltaproteobacteria bacterium]|nr:HD domain-containing protein [Deltaproteobacteria bacterium]